MRAAAANTDHFHPLPRVSVRASGGCGPPSQGDTGASPPAMRNGWSHLLGTFTGATAARSAETAGVVQMNSPPSVRRVASLRVAFGLVWSVDAVLKWLPGFRDGFSSMLDQAASAQPGFLRSAFYLFTELPRREAIAMAFLSAAIETFLAFALVTGFARKSVYVFGAAYSTLIWAVGEGFGAPYMSGSTDVGPALLYAFVFAALLLLDCAGPNDRSLDAYLETRVSWWHRIAETGTFAEPEVRLAATAKRSTSPSTPRSPTKSA